MKFYKICIVMLLLARAPAAMALGDDAELARRLDAAIGKRYPANGPGASIIVVKDGATIFRQSYGMANIENKLPMTPAMSLRIGSVTKQFTAAAILMLDDEGKLALTDDIQKYVPGFPASSTPVTIEHLLTHTSGIANYTSMPGYFARSAAPMRVDEMIDYFKDQPRQFDAGQRWSYSNSNYFLLGAIVEQVSGMAYADFLAYRVFIPLGMNDTAYEGHERSALKHMQGYSRRQNKIVPSLALDMSQPYAAGALVSTVDDLARWDAAIAAGKLLKQSSWNRIFTPYRLADGAATKYGYGWEIGKFFGLKIMSHTGRINGFTSAVLRIPEQKLYVAVLGNIDDGADQEAVAAQAAAIVMNPIGY